MNATVVVMIDQDALTGRLARAGRLDTGERISPGGARRLACAAGILPAVMGGESRVLDLGSRRRFHSGDQRIVFAIEQGGCSERGCDWPPGMCHAHHPKASADGGETNRDGMLLCPRHHTLAHHPSYEITHHPGGKVSFHRRT